MRTTAIAALVAMAATACSKEAPHDAPAASASAAPSAAAIGLGASGNDPALVDAAKSVLAACAGKWSATEGFRDCAPLNAYRETVRKGEPGKDDATFVAFLEDPDERVRALGLEGIHARGNRYKIDPDLAMRLVGALEREKAPAIDGEMAYFVAQIDPAKVPAATDRIKKLALAPATAADIKTFLGGWWGTESKNDAASDVDVALANDPQSSAKVKRAALQGLNAFFAAHTADVCRLWFDNVASADDAIAAAATGLVTGGAAGVSTQDEQSGWFASGGGGGRDDADRQCAQIDAALDALLARAKAGKMSDDAFVYAAAGLLGPKKAPDAAKKKAGRVLLATIDAKDNKQRRATALRQLFQKEPTLVPPLAKLEKDADLKDTVATFAKSKK